MSSSSLLSLGARALNANQAALQVVGHNIANVNTNGYSRQTVQFTSAGGQLLGNGYFGKGVDIAGIERSHSEYLTRDATQSNAIRQADQIRADSLHQLEGVFPTGATGIGAAMNDMLNAFSDVAAAPSDLTARSVVLTRASEMTARFRTASQRLDDMTQGVREQMSNMLDQVNTLSQQIASVNEKITNAHGNGLTPNDLLDQRDQLIHDLNRYVRTDTVADSSGAVNVFVAGSQALVLGKDAHKLELVRDEFDPAQGRLAVDQASQPNRIDEQALGGGQISGLIRFRDQDLTEARNLLGRMATALTSAVNAQHTLGLDLTGVPGKDLIGMAAIPESLAATSNTGNGAIQTGISSAADLMASDYELRFESNQIQVVRLSDGQVSAFNALPAQVDGLSFQMKSGTAQIGDRYLVRPYASAAASLQNRIIAPRALAAASPVLVIPSAGNSAGLGIGSLQATSANANLNNPITLTFTSTGQFDVNGAGTGNPNAVAYQPGQPISYNGWTLVLQGIPAAGDTLTISPNTMPARNAGNAQAMLNLRDLTSLDGATLADGYANLLAQIGSRVQGATDAAQISSSIASSAEQAKTSVSGVNLDEEAARLLQYQQSYQAAAKILQVAQSAFDSLLNNLSH